MVLNDDDDDANSSCSLLGQLKHWAANGFVFSHVQLNVGRVWIHGSEGSFDCENSFLTFFICFELKMKNEKIFFLFSFFFYTSVFTMSFSHF